LHFIQPKSSFVHQLTLLANELNQGSFMIPILPPLPIHHLQPRKRCCLDRQILRQAKLGLWSKEVSRREEWEKYLDLNNRTTKEPVF
jgi:hypothetical protein